MAPSAPKLSLVAQFDDLCRYTSVLTEGIEADFINFVQKCQGYHKQFKSAETEIKLLQQELEKVKKNATAVEKQLKHSRSHLEAEMKKRKKAENERDNLARQIDLLRKILLTDPNAVNDQTRVKLAFLNENQNFKHRESPQRLETIDESEGSLLSTYDVSFDQTNENLMDDYHESSSRRSKRSSPQGQSGPTTKRTRKAEIEERADGQTSIIATTTVSIPPTGDVIAKSQIETMPSGIKRSTRAHSEPAPPKTPVPSFRSSCKSENTKETPIRQTPRNFARPTATYPQETPKTTGGSKPIQHYSSSGKLNMRAHVFCTKTVIRPETCSPCGRKIKFYKQALKCQDCRATCHPECKDQVPLPCVPICLTPTSKSIGDTIADYTPMVPPMVPALVVHCVNEIEKRGMSEVGLYRVSGADREVKELKEKFLRGRGVPNLLKYEVHALCGTLKEFLRSLSDPLITRTAWNDFVSAAEMKDDEDVQSCLYQAISQLPRPNRDTLAFIIVHLQKIAGEPNCKMPVPNLARVFGPTIVGFSTPDPTTADMIVETKKQHMVMEKLLNLSGDYWNNFVNVERENIYPVPSKTPEYRTTPVGTMLGPVPGLRNTPGSWSKKSKTLLTNVGKKPLTPRNNSNKNSGRRKNFFTSPIP